MNVLTHCVNEKCYLQVSVQTTGNHAVAAVSVVRGGALIPANVTLKRGRLDQLPLRAVLDMSQMQDAVSLRGLVPGQSIQFSMLRQVWRIKAGQRVLVIANGDGFRVSAEGKALNDAAVAQNARVRMISGQVVSDAVDSDGNIFVNL